ncbi:MAG TPA: family 78 glycoside hydrolase catalytic domain, partial [Clostridia bacterium]|nr:family 78 glycoside hydrolase catalytic domain [Clostridia bacterium]
MTVQNLMTNRVVHPLGRALPHLRLSYTVEAEGDKVQAAARVVVALDAGMQSVVFDSGRDAGINSLCFVPDLCLKPRTRYFWQVEVWGDAGGHAVSDLAWFETGKRDEPWQAQWIGADLPGNQNVFKDIELTKPVRSARAYACGVGLYELYINGNKAGDEFLAPHYNAYDQWLQVQTLDVTDCLKPGVNRVLAMLGDGWYKGRFGFRGQTALYGEQQAFLMELHVSYADGEEACFVTDLSWQAEESRVRFANIYDGEVYDATFEPSGAHPVQAVDLGYDRLTDRLSLPVVIAERIAPKEILTTPAGETVLDLGQEITGWLEFRTAAPRGTKLHLMYGEILQHGNFYNENLRSAKAEFTYVCDGGETAVRPHFTFYGFRYVKLEGFDGAKLSDFAGCVVHSDLRRAGWLTTDHAKVNRLILNALWGQRGNFLDVPTDCPQRDERMGWTGDAQAFSGTACFNMDCAAFFEKYLHDMRLEQIKLDGAVPHVVPKVGLPGEASCAWADAATIIPWTVYTFYGDKQLLSQQYPLMRDWADWLYRNDEAHGATRLWHNGF